jgi:6-phosphogluconolactonase
LAFSTSGRYAFVNGEADLTLSLFRYEAGTGTLQHIQHLRTVPDGIDTEGHSTAQMRVHPQGRFVYVANRGSDTIAVFHFDEEAERIELRGTEPTRGLTPRNFEIDGSGRWLYVANQNSNAIECFAVDTATGALKHVRQAAKVPAPTCIRFA